VDARRMDELDLRIRSCADGSFVVALGREPA
jgi:hypothetical protein